MPFEPNAIERLVIARIERCRATLPPPRHVPIQPVLDGLTRKLSRTFRQETALQAAWRRVAPPFLLTRVSPISLASGTLTLAASDRSAGFLASRFLAAGGRAALAMALGVVITRTTIKSDQSPHGPAPHQA